MYTPLRLIATDDCKQQVVLSCVCYRHLTKEPPSHLTSQYTAAAPPTTHTHTTHTHLPGQFPFRWRYISNLFCNLQERLKHQHLTKIIGCYFSVKLNLKQRYLTVATSLLRSSQKRIQNLDVPCTYAQVIVPVDSYSFHHRCVLFMNNSVSYFMLDVSYSWITVEFISCSVYEDFQLSVFMKKLISCSLRYI